MKKCTYCGQTYSDDAIDCTTDQQPLVSVPSGAGVSGKLEGPAHELSMQKVSLKVSEKDNGLWMVWKCPRCADLSNFNAIVSRGSVRIIGIEVGQPTTLFDLRCTRCKFELRVDATERPALEKLGELTRLLTNHELSAGDYTAQVRQLAARFIKDLEALTQNWKCAACGEENPITFEECWNCSSKANPAALAVADDAKPFPTAPKAGNPWESQE